MDIAPNRSRWDPAGRDGPPESIRSWDLPALRASGRLAHPRPVAGSGRPDPRAQPRRSDLIEWFLANDARILFGDFSLVNDRINAPDGFNMLVNATVIVPGFLLAPVTLLFGAATSFALLAAGNLAVTATGWYLLYTRTLGAHRVAAAIGAGFCGFAPGMVSQSNSHPHMTAQWLVPAMVWCVVRLVQLADPKNHADRSSAARRLVAVAVTLAAAGEHSALRRRGGALPGRHHARSAGGQLRGGGPEIRPARTAPVQCRHPAGGGAGADRPRVPDLDPVQWCAERAERRLQPRLLLCRPVQLHGDLATLR